MTGIAIRRARAGDARAVARVHVESWRTTYPGIIPDRVIVGSVGSLRRTKYTAVRSNMNLARVLDPSIGGDGEHRRRGLLAGVRQSHEDQKEREHRL